MVRRLGRNHLESGWATEGESRIVKCERNIGRYSPAGTRVVRDGDLDFDFCPGDKSSWRTTAAKKMLVATEIATNCPRSMYAHTSGIRLCDPV
jgi:hypothetical protein